MVNEKAETRTRARWIPKIGRNQIKTVEMQLTKRASFNGDAKHMAGGNLLKHSRSLHLETLYRLYFFFVIYTINVERQREREKAQFSERERKREK